MNKGGWLRIVEASLAVILILSALFVFYMKEKSSSPPDLGERARTILEEIASDATLRNSALTAEKGSSPQNIINLVASQITEPNLDFEIKICEIGDACGKSKYNPGNIYSAERVISASVDHAGYEPKKMRLFIWNK